MPRRFKSSGVGANNVEFSYEINGATAFNPNDTVGYRNAISGFSITNSGSTSTFFSTDIPANLDIQFDENNRSLTLRMSSISFGNRGTIIEAIFKHNLQFLNDADFQALKNSVTSNNLEDIINRLAISSGLSDNGSYITYDLTMENFLNQNFPNLIDNVDDNGDGLENTAGRHNDWSGQFITVFPGVEIPIANNDSFTVNEDSILNINLPGVLSNDTDVDNANLTAIIENQASNGTIALNADGSFTYTPNPNFSGQDTFTYKARKTADFDPRPNDERIGNVDSDLATVTITVNALKIPIANNDSFTVNQDNILNITLPAGVLSNDTGIDITNLTAVIATQPSNGNVTLNGNGSFTYTPNSNFSGQDTFTYIARKTADANVVSNPATVTITVNAIEIPIANNDIFTVFQDSIFSIALPGVLSNDTDVDNASLTAVIETQSSNGTVSLNADGSFTYAPNPNFSGQDTFTYKARKIVNNNNVDSKTATVTIKVNSVTPPPIEIPVANNDNFSVNENSVLNITLPAGVLSNDTGVDIANLTAVIATQPSNGNVTLNGNGSFTYTPNSNFSGQDTFTYKARKTADANVVSNPATVTIKVNSVTPPPIEIPVANNDNFNVNENSVLNITLPAGVLSNDTGVDIANLTAVIATQPSNGNVTLNGNGSFTYTPNSNFSGQDTFTYIARKTADANVVSNPATVTIRVNAVDTPPINNLNDPIYRFQNGDRPGTYLFAGEQESQSIRQNFPQFREEGFAFNVSSEPNDELIVFNRFQNTAIPGTYLYAGQQESQNIRQNFPNFREEGVAFYAYDGNANKGVDFYRFQNTQQPGTYLFVGEEERRNIIANFPQFVEEGVAFEVGV
ncbi:alkaline phosphatase [Geminocystis sp. NIES-3708]|uniref:Ig-like domain-containing protein n=1 Tax=Geminocystis sp. NIES-3708 TaxID=1615909 RepID=UPI0005FC7E68|nr:Ig-like domain-containing protein [Geminocystis sp. NIES-3708]BAQ60088.1 alkaline phosphatase [Geminocystis sp. NIES-3708]